jgi:hypothetical protein
MADLGAVGVDEGELAVGSGPTPPRVARADLDAELAQAVEPRP